MPSRINSNDPAAKNAGSERLILLVSGGADFCRRATSSLRRSYPTATITACSLLELRQSALEQRPDLLIVEIGLAYTQRLHDYVTGALQYLRERRQKQMIVVVALTAPERIAFGGSLLFSARDSQTASGLVDTFVAQPPALMVGQPDLAEQLAHAVRIGRVELHRRSQGQVPLPCLNESSWVQSLADPASRELWALWLPRYASYISENPIILGETGTGKTNLARAIHQLSGRSGQFVSITPRDFSSSELVQAELFGAVPGAYTGAIDKWGLVNSAEKGTLFIDELQSIDKDLQGKIITFIENKSYRRVGSAESIAADVRIVFASNRQLPELMEQDVLRADFAYRLERVQLEIRPLSQRRLDIPAALAYALAKLERQRPQAQAVSGVTSRAFSLLFGHSWPGNLRQLENTVARLCEFCDLEQSTLIEEQHVLQTLKLGLGSGALDTRSLAILAARSLADKLNQRAVSDYRQAQGYLCDRMRELALESSAGDIAQAATLTGDDPAALRIFAESALAKRASGPINGA